MVAVIPLFFVVAELRYCNRWRRERADLDPAVVRAGSYALARRQAA